MLKNKYRIVRDRYAGFEVQIKKWWFPFAWFQCHGVIKPVNTHLTIELAKDFIVWHKKRQIKIDKIYQDKVVYVEE